ncbi:MAG TPA: GDP-4-dehydro-6-deoxy-D-mannose reductase, partial [Candidatus Thermoplasmatota archaeon]|nr:GDP-4-dehydro-6-deoxy-D-mannose reductase [Candidatus Thermoplasmatota archaeon]
VCAAYRILAVKVPAGSVVNVGSGHGVRIRDVAERLLALAGVKAAVEVDAARVRGAGEIGALVADNARLRALGWAPRHTLDETLGTVLADWTGRWASGDA